MKIRRHPSPSIRDMNDSFTGNRGRPAQTIAVLTNKHSPSTVDVSRGLRRSCPEAA